MLKRTPIRRTPLKRKPRKKQPGDDPKYLAWIRTLPCVVCVGMLNYWPWLDRVLRGYVRYVQTTGATESAHVGLRGLGQKAPDRTAIPLCPMHHRIGKYAHHQIGKNFWTYHNLDRDSIIKQLNERYNQLHV